MESPAPPPTDPLGPRVELFTMSMANVYVGIIVGSMLVIGGLGLGGCGLNRIPHLKSDKLAKGQLVGGLVGGGFLGLIGALGIWYSRSMRGTGVEVCEKGIREWPATPGSYVFLWNEVVRIEERYIYDKVPLKLGGPLLSETYRQFGVICRDGRQRGSIGRTSRTWAGSESAFAKPLPRIRSRGRSSGIRDN